MVVQLSARAMAQESVAVSLRESDKPDTLRSHKQRKTVSTMRKIDICFDVDGTLIDSEGNPNTRIVDLLRTLAGFKNTRIIVWTGTTKAYALSVVRQLGIERYVDKCMSKNHVATIKKDDGKKYHIFEPGFVPDIAVDDIQSCELGMLNLIVREK